MAIIKKSYGFFCKAEEIVVAALTFAIMVLVFSGAVMRTIGNPINWAVDLSLLLFAWLIFLGADVAIRTTDLVSIDLVIKRFPGIVQDIVFVGGTILALIFLYVLMRYGVPLAIENYERPFHSLGISFSYATIAAPVGSFLISISLIIRLVGKFKSRGKESAETEKSNQDEKN